MLIKLNQEIKSIFTGKPVKENDEPMTLKKLCVTALINTYVGEERLSGEDKFKRYQLATKIQNAKDDVDLISEEITLLKLLIGKGWSPMIVGQCYEMLEKENKK